MQFKYKDLSEKHLQQFYDITSKLELSNSKELSPARGNWFKVKEAFGWAGVFSHIYDK